MKPKAWKDVPATARHGWLNGGSYFCRAELTSLEGAPAHVADHFDCGFNKLSSLKGAPAHIGGGLFCSHNRLISLEGAPSFIGNVFFCENNNLTSLKNIHLQIKHIGFAVYFDGNPIKSHVLGLLLIDGLQKVTLDNEPVGQIISKHLPSRGIESVLEAQDELIVAGYEAYAQL